MTPAQELYISIGRQLNAEESQMFGKPCFKINKKAFICFFEESCVFKLTGSNHSEALHMEGAIHFDPSGKNRPMKEWIQLPYTCHNHWEKFAASAFEYVNNTAG